MDKTKLQAVRRQLDYTSGAVIAMLRQRANALNVTIMNDSSLKTKLSEWENGRSTVSAPYRRLFRDIYGRTNEELGFPADPETDEAAELRSLLAVARSVDSETVALFRRQLENARSIDRKYGGITVLDQLRGSITQIEGMLRYSTTHGQRETLANVLTETSALAGWEALDRNAIKQAWDHHERAKAAAREAGAPILLAHSLAQQAFILIDIGEETAAVEQLGQARELANGTAPALLRSWLAAAHGEGLAAAGQRDGSLRAFEAADRLLPGDPIDPALSFLFLGGAHLDRWRGHALSKLGERDAIEQLNDALPRLPASFVRARTGMLVDLAFAYAAAGDRDQALEHSRQARRLARQIKSDRQLRRLDGLILPGGSGRSP